MSTIDYALSLQNSILSLLKQKADNAEMVERFVKKLVTYVDENAKFLLRFYYGNF